MAIVGVVRTGLLVFLVIGCEGSGEIPLEPDAKVTEAGLPDVRSPAEGGASDAGDAQTRDAGSDLDAGREPVDAAVDPDAGDAQFDAGDAAIEPYDLGPMPWEQVAVEDVAEECKLDPAALRRADEVLGVPWAVIRYGKLCHQHRAPDQKPGEIYSTTKTLSALVAGAVAYQTRGLVRSGRKTGPFSDMDRVDHWLDAFDYNPDAQVGHVLGMVAHNPSLAFGERSWEYDTAGVVQINSLADMLEAAVAQDGARLGGDLDTFSKRFVFEKLGLANSMWTGVSARKLIAFSWSADIYDMAKVGWLMLRGGMWKGERLLESEWVYRMTHPSFEDATTAYGYLTQLNASAGYVFREQRDGVGAILPGPCAPVAIYREYPHGLSGAPDCNYGAIRSCEQTYDVGVWQAVGLLGQVIQGHPGLDLVVVARNLTADDPDGNPSMILWDALRPAVIAEDPTYAGDAQAFCEAYGGNDYAPDWVPFM